MKPLGLMATEDGAGIDFHALRQTRRARVLDEMGRQGVDVLVLGRRGNGKYVAGHRSLWRAVLTPFGPLCIVVRDTQQVHLMGTTWDDGIPREIPTDNLSGLMWNPRLSVEALARIPGLALRDAHRDRRDEPRHDAGLHDARARRRLRRWRAAHAPRAVPEAPRRDRLHSRRARRSQKARWRRQRPCSFPA